MTYQNKTESNREEKPIGRRSVLKMAIAAGLVGIPTLYGASRLTALWKGNPNMFDWLAPAEAMPDGSPLPVPAIDKLVPPQTQTASFAMG